MVRGAEEEGLNHQVVSFKSPADTPGMLRKSTAFVPRYQKFESISLQRGVNCEPDFYPGLGSRGRERLRRLTGYKPDEKVRQSTDDLSSVA